MSFTLLQKGQLRHWQRGQWLPALFSLQNVAQLSTLWSPGKLELHAALVAMGAGSAPAPRAAIELYRMTAARGRADFARSWRNYFKEEKRSIHEASSCDFLSGGPPWSGLYGPVLWLILFINLAARSWKECSEKY